MENIITWVSGSQATAISYGLNIMMFFLTIAGFILYFNQKKQYRLLFAMMEQFELADKIKKDTSKVKKELDATTSRIDEAKKELNERLPQEAKRAYYENAIPAVEKQIYDLSIQLKSMTGELENVGGGTEGNSPEIDKILSEEVRNHVSVRRDLERTQGLLAICTGTTAAIGFILPFPLSLLAMPTAVIAIIQCFIMFRLWKRYYGERKWKKIS